MSDPVPPESSPPTLPSPTSLDRLQRSFYGLAMICLVVLILYTGKVVLVPIALAVLLSFALSPPSDWLEARKVPRRFSVPIVIVVSVLLLGMAGWTAARQIRALSNEIPKHRENLDRKIEPILRFSEGLSKLQEVGKKSPDKPPLESKPGDAPTPVVVAPPGSSGLSYLPTLAQPVVEILANTFLVFVLTIFFLAQRESLRARVIGLVGRTRLTGTTRALEDAGKRVGQYLLLQLGTNAAVGLAVGIGLTFMGVPYAALWGLLTVLLRFLPYVGIWASALGPVLLTVAISPGWTQPFLILGIYVAIDLLMANVVEPLLFSHGTGVSSVALLIAAVFWAWLWGPVGLLLATPLTVCLVVLGKHVPSLKFLGLLLGDESTLDPAARYYDRVLARDYDEVTLMLKEYAEGKTADQVYDDVILPALAQAKTDREQQDLTADQEQAVYDTTGQMLKMLARHPAADTPPAPALRAIGCAVKGEADTLALQMLRDALGPSGAGVTVVTPADLLAEVGKETQTGRPVGVCLTALSPGGLTQCGELCKQIKAQYPQTRVIVARWGETQDTTQTAAYLKDSGADFIGWSLQELKAELVATGRGPGSKPKPDAAPGPKNRRRRR